MLRGYAAPKTELDFLHHRLIPQAQHWHFEVTSSGGSLLVELRPCSPAASSSELVGLLNAQVDGRCGGEVFVKFLNFLVNRICRPGLVEYEFASVALPAMVIPTESSIAPEVEEYDRQLFVTVFRPGRRVSILRGKAVAHSLDGGLAFLEKSCGRGKKWVPGAWRRLLYISSELSPLRIDRLPLRPDRVSKVVDTLKASLTTLHDVGQAAFCVSGDPVFVLFATSSQMNDRLLQYLKAVPEPFQELLVIAENVLCEY